MRLSLVNKKCFVSKPSLNRQETVRGDVRRKLKAAKSVFRGSLERRCPIKPSEQFHGFLETVFPCSGFPKRAVTGFLGSGLTAVSPRPIGGRQR